MVKNILFLFILILMSVPKSYAIFQQTAEDLLLLEDSLQSVFSDEQVSITEYTPMLVATPIPIWKQSEVDFPEKMKSLLGKVFKGQGKLYSCPDCDTYRLHVKEHGSLQINNGPLSISDMRLIRQYPQYKNAKTVAFSKETPSGVVLEIVRIDDGVILFYKLADSTQELQNIQPWFNYQREYERRKRGESLSFVRMNMGLWPSGAFAFEFLEQWGDRNQHISGAAISFIGPTAALGATYHFLSPSIKELDFGAGIFFPLQNIANQGDTAENAITSLAFQVNATYLFSDSVGVFAAGFFGQENGFSVGLSFYNPAWIPFIL